jgi:hypothetical protein
MDQRADKNRIYFCPCIPRLVNLRWQMPEVWDGASPRRHTLCPAPTHGEQPFAPHHHGGNHGRDHGGDLSTGPALVIVCGGMVVMGSHW